MQRQDTSRHLVPARDDLSRAEGEVNVTLIEDLAAWQHALVGHHHSLAVLLADNFQVNDDADPAQPKGAA